MNIVDEYEYFNSIADQHGLYVAIEYFSESIIYKVHYLSDIEFHLENGTRRSWGIYRCTTKEPVFPWKWTETECKQFCLSLKKVPQDGKTLDKLMKK